MQEFYTGRGQSIERSKITFNKKPYLLIFTARGPVSEMKKILNADANINHKDYKKRTLLSHAAEYRKNGLIKILLIKDADVNSKDNLRRISLIWVAAMDSSAAVRTLFRAGADINDNSYDGRTALSFIV